MRTAALMIVLIFAASRPLMAQVEFRISGSAGSEAHRSPPDPDSPLNPGNLLNLKSGGNSSDITLFTELIPEDKSWKLHVKLRGAGEYQENFASRLDISELYWDFAITTWLDVTIGRKIEKWGTGYAWNPTGVVNPRKDPRDPGDRRDTHSGADMVRADLLIKGWSTSLLAVPKIDWSGDSEQLLQGAGWAGKVYRLIRGTDLSFTASGGSGLPKSAGISAARVIGNSLELHGEAVAFKDHFQMLLGGQYTFSGNVNLIIEAFHNGSGLNTEEWLGFRNLVQSGTDDLKRGQRGTLLGANLSFTPLSMSKNYGFARLNVPLVRNKVDLEVVALTSLRDGSSLFRPGVYWKVHSNWTLYWIQTEFPGGPNSEFGHVQIQRISDVGLRFHF